MILAAALAALPLLAQGPGKGGGAVGPVVLRSMESLLNPLGTASSNPVAVRGVVTLVRKHVVYIQDQTGALAVFPDQMAPLAIGDEVEIQGEFRRADSSPALYHPAIRKLWSGSPPVPMAVSPEQAAEGSFRSRLIDTEGRLLQKTVSGDYLKLTLEGDSQIFGATLELSAPVSADAELVGGLEEGATLRLVGVCAPNASFEQSVGNAFAILLRSTDDIRVISPPPWWNLRHAVLVGIASMALLSLFYVLRHRSLNQRFQAIVEERSRMAREMHDTLAQGFSGLTYQLEGIAGELKTAADKQSIERQLGMALQLVRHCREEAHRSIFALRSLTQSHPDLLSLLLASCDLLRTNGGVRLSGTSEGKPVAVSDEVSNHLIRIGQEAITNAFCHSGASEIKVALRFLPGHIRMEVADNGSGFHIDEARSVDSGHFGITGMKERVKYIDATLEILSEPGQGTRIIVDTPVVNGSRWMRLIRTGNDSRRPKNAGKARA